MPTVQELESHIYELKKQLDQLRKDTPPESVDPETTFQSHDGPVALKDLFGDHDHLVLIHNMGASCPFCTMWADTLQSSLPYLVTRANVVLVSPDSPDHQAKLAEHRGWKFQMLHDPDKAFTTKMGYYSDGDDYTGFMPGTSVFKKLPDGSIVRTNHTVFGPLDDFNPVWHFWSLLDGNSSDWEPHAHMFTS